MTMSDTIKEMIPSLMTDKEVTRIQSLFVGVTDIKDCKLNKKDLSNSKHWKRILKEKIDSPYDGKFIERIFDYRPADDQLRLTVITDFDDREIKSIEISGE